MTERARLKSYLLMGIGAIGIIIIVATPSGSTWGAILAGAVAGGAILDGVIILYRIRTQETALLNSGQHIKQE